MRQREEEIKQEAILQHKLSLQRKEEEHVRLVNEEAKKKQLLLQQQQQQQRDVKITHKNGSELNNAEPSPQKSLAEDSMGKYSRQFLQQFEAVMNGQQIQSMSVQHDANYYNVNNNSNNNSNNNNNNLIHSINHDHNNNINVNGVNGDVNKGEAYAGSQSSQRSLFNQREPILSDVSIPFSSHSSRSLCSAIFLQCGLSFFR